MANWRRCSSPENGKHTQRGLGKGVLVPSVATRRREVDGAVQIRWVVFLLRVLLAGAASAVELQVEVPLVDLRLEKK